MIAGPPASTDVPAAVLRLAEGAPVRPVWRNEVGGLTFAVGHDRYVKWTPPTSGIDLAAEAERLAWAAPFTPVPRVLDLGSDHEGSWVVTAALAGSSAVDDRWKRDPATAVRAIGEGLRALHDDLPVDACPFTWSVEERLARAGPRVPDALREPPPVDRLVVCHGDACAPNTLIGADGRWVAHVDFGTLGVADRWADLAVATWSTEWNYGPGWEVALLEAYGIDPDPARTAYYRALWDAAD